MIPVKRGEQAICVFLVLNLDESSAEVVNGLRHTPVLVHRVVHLVLRAGALLVRGHLLLVALKLDRGVVLPHASAPRHGLAAVDVQLRVVLPAVPLGAHLVCVLEHLDTCGRRSVRYVICNYGICGSGSVKYVTCNYLICCVQCNMTGALTLGLAIC